MMTGRECAMLPQPQVTRTASSHRELGDRWRTVSPSRLWPDRPNTPLVMDSRLPERRVIVTAANVLLGWPWDPEGERCFLQPRLHTPPTLPNGVGRALVRVPRQLGRIDGPLQSEVVRLAEPFRLHAFSVLINCLALSRLSNASNYHV